MPHADQGLELVILGAGPAYSDLPGSVGASYLVRLGDDGIVLDLGQGAFPALARAIEPSRLTAVVISHLHPDHFIDLIPLRHYLRRAEFQPPRRVPLVAPEGILDRLDGAWGQAGFAATAFDAVDGAVAPAVLGPFTLESVRVTHAGESRAWRVGIAGSDAPGVVYSGDASDPDEIAPLVRPGDLLLSESSYGAAPVPAGMPHLCSEQVGRLAATTRAGSVVVTHVRMGTDLDAAVAAVAERYAGPVGLAVPGARFPVGA